MTTVAGLLGSISMSFIKGVTETFRHDGLFGGFVLYMYVAVALSIGILQLKSINRSMELYEQVDTIPIYQTSLILLNIAAGAIVMQEARLYTFQEFLLIILCGLVSISGV